MKPSVICAALLSFLALPGLAPAKAASTDASTAHAPCRLSVVAAELAAVGSSHHFAEYAIQIVPTPATIGPASPAPVWGPFTVHLTAGTDAGATTPVTVDNVGFGPPFQAVGTIPIVLVILQNPGVRWF